MSDAIIASIDAVRTRASTQETLLVLAVPVEYSASIAKFLAMVGQQIGVAFADIGEKQTAEPEKQTGHWVSALYKSGWFFNPKVLAALGSDAEYLAWIQRQPSCVSGSFSEYVNGEGRCIAAHVRRAGESGTGYKAEYSCVPMTDAEHQQQHREGESALGGKGFFDEQRNRYLQAWGHHRLREILGVETLKSSEARFVEWADRAGLSATLPLALRNAEALAGNGQHKGEKA